MTRRQNIQIEGSDDYDFKIIEDFLGYNSSIDPTKTTQADGVLVRGSQNVYKKLSGTIAVRPGLKTRGSLDATSAGTKSSWEWNTWDGRVLPLRINNNKLQVESDIVTSGTYVWYTLLSGLASSFDRAVFDSYWVNSVKQDILLFVGGTSTQYRWTGAMAKFVSATPVVITLDRDAATAGFTNGSSSVIINGTTYTYTGISGSTLTGVGTDASLEPVDSVVIESVATSANTPASGFNTDFIKVINNQVYCGSYSSRAIYISKNTSYTDFTQSTPRVTGDGELVILDNNAKGISQKDGNAFIGAGTSDWYRISFTQITVGAVLSEQTKREKLPTSINSAPLAHEFIDTVGNEIICLTQDHQVRKIGQFTNQFTTKYPSLSLAMKTEFEEEDFTGGHLKNVGDFIYITAPVNGRDYMHETRESVNELGQIVTEKFWHAPQIRNISRIAVINGVVYGHSNANPQIYRIWDTGQWYDDSPDGEQIPYSAVMLLKYITANRRQGKMNFDKLFTEGYSVPGAELYYGIYFDYQGSTALLSDSINTTEFPFQEGGIFTGQIPPSLGDASLGDNPLGDGLSTAFNDQALVPKFKQTNGVPQTDCFEYAIMIYSQSANARWEILAVGTNHKMSSALPVEINKQT